MDGVIGWSDYDCEQVNDFLLEKIAVGALHDVWQISSSIGWLTKLAVCGRDEERMSGDVKVLRDKPKMVMLMFKQCLLLVWGDLAKKR